MIETYRQVDIPKNYKYPKWKCKVGLHSFERIKAIRYGIRWATVFEKCNCCKKYREIDYFWNVELIITKKYIRNY